MAGVAWAGGGATLGALSYRTFDDADLATQAGFCCFGAAGRQAAARPNSTVSATTLVAAWLDDRHVRWMAWFDAAVERHVASGAEPLLAPFDAISEWVHSPGYRGCAFINAIAETSEIDDTHRAIIAAHKRDLLEHVRLLATRSTRALPEWVPDAVAVLIDGAIVQTAIYGDDSPIAPARAAAAQLLKAAP